MALKKHRSILPTQNLKTSCFKVLLGTFLLWGTTELSALEPMELRGSFSLNARTFGSDGLDHRQEDQGFSLNFEPEAYWDLNADTSLTITPRFSLDQNDEERNRVDLREAYLLHLRGDWEFKLGISQVFWGRTEFLHLVDVINQTDILEGIDGEEKLGQPMVEATYPLGEGTLQAWILPGFRKRTFPGVEGRLRANVIVDNHTETYESGAEEQHVDYALRYSAYVGDLELGFSGFHGTHREPKLSFHPASGKLVPHYRQTTQVSLDAVAVYDAWLFKFEGLNRKLEGEHHQAVTAGSEITFVGISESEHDLGWILEGAWHSEKDRESAFASEIMTGFRWVWNDVQGTELLAGAIVDWGKSSQIFSIEASRRIGDAMKIELEARVFSNIDPKDPIYAYRKDNYLQMEWFYYF